jgi:ABC-type multidrug transport system fused ATPase/permease subunit
LETSRSTTFACRLPQVNASQHCSCHLIFVVTFRCEGLWGGLHKVSFEISGGECCGVLSSKASRGRSSFVAALLRMAELTSGRITIDSQNIAQLGLVRLRQCMSVVPQQPVLFSGSIRNNLDPLSLHSDEEVTILCFCWQLFFTSFL